MFAGIISAFIVGNLIPDDAWETLANEGFVEEERIMENKREERKREEEARVGGEGNEGGGRFDDYD